MNLRNFKKWHITFIKSYLNKIQKRIPFIKQRIWLIIKSVLLNRLNISRRPQGKIWNIQYNNELNILTRIRERRMYI